MGPILRTVIWTLCLLSVVLIPIHAFGQAAENSPSSPFTPSAQNNPSEPPALASVVESPEDFPPPKPGPKSSSLPVFPIVVVQDNPDDSGNAILIKWMITQGPSVRLFKEENIPDQGDYGLWKISKTFLETLVCSDGNRQKDEKEETSTYMASLISKETVQVKILRARFISGSIPGPFKVIATLNVGGEVEKEEYRFNEGVRTIFEPGKTQRTSEKVFRKYEITGNRVVRYRFWQSYVDKTAKDGVSYIYRVVVTNGTEIAYAFHADPVAMDKIRNKYEHLYDFGPISSEINVIPPDKEAFTNLKTRLQISIAPPHTVNAEDNPSDSGDALLIEWQPSSDDLDLELRSLEEMTNSPNPILEYIIYRAEILSGKPGDYLFVGTTGVGFSSNERKDQKFKDIKLKYFIDIDAMGEVWDYDQCAWYTPKYDYIVAARTKDGISFSGPSGSASSKTQWFDKKRTTFLIIALIISGAIIWFIRSIKSGKKLFVRKIAGLEAIDEAIGRATEMGRPILFIPGIQDMNDVQTVSAVIILGRIAKTIAEYDTQLMVPTSRSLVMTTARETVKEAYLSAGRPDAYNDDMITYLTDEQFGYVAGVNGIMVREKPATCFYLGAFFAESLILAETGNHIGAIQIAGTAMPSQLPFFIAACDYTLIGEELFAASAYLSHDPKQLGSLKGQDIGKLIAIITIFSGIVLATIAELSGSETTMKIYEFFRNLFEVA